MPISTEELSILSFYASDRDNEVFGKMLRDRLTAGSEAAMVLDALQGRGDPEVLLHGRALQVYRLLDASKRVDLAAEFGIKRPRAVDRLRDRAKGIDQKQMSKSAKLLNNTMRSIRAAHKGAKSQSSTRSLETAR